MWTADGKFWHSLGHVKSHLNQFTNKNPYNRYPCPYDGTETVVEYMLVRTDEIELKSVLGKGGSNPPTDISPKRGRKRKWQKITKFQSEIVC